MSPHLNLPKAASLLFSSSITLLSIGLCILQPLAAKADVKPHALISEGMVLQQKTKAKIWGTAAPGEKVTVHFRDQQASTTANEEGRWLIALESKEAGGPFAMTITGKNQIAYKNILVGEVWICSGQSNMGWPLAPRPGDKATEGTENASIRLFIVPEKMADAPQRDVDARWEVCGPSTVGQFSAVGYYFGRDLQKTLGVPVGLIHTCMGGSPAGEWISRRAIEEDPDLQPLRELRAQAAEKQAQQMERMKPELDRYRQAVAKAKQEGKTPPPPPRGFSEPVSSRLFNGMIAPLMPLSIRGVIWYQGEANVSQPVLYRSMFPGLIKSWRKEWGQGEFPFLFVQVAPYLKIVDEPRESSWAELREAQLWTNLTVRQTGMAVITDWGNEVDIHPKPKRPIGERLALVARAMVYGEKLVHAGPLCSGMKIEANKVILTFTQTGGGLIGKKLVLEDIQQGGRPVQTGGALHVATDDSSTGNASLQGFCIAGEDQKFINAQAEIQGNTVVVSSPQVARPAFVRYGWADYPTGNLFNKEGFPTTPFRTDGPPLVIKPRE
jgi:sialate O-acetylesterase